MLLKLSFFEIWQSKTLIISVNYLTLKHHHLQSRKLIDFTTFLSEYLLIYSLYSVELCLHNNETDRLFHHKTKTHEWSHSLNEVHTSYFDFQWLK
jgi:hypothetical protein